MPRVASLQDGEHSRPPTTLSWHLAEQAQLWEKNTRSLFESRAWSRELTWISPTSTVRRPLKSATSKCDGTITIPRPDRTLSLVIRAGMECRLDLCEIIFRHPPRANVPCQGQLAGVAHWPWHGTLALTRHIGPGMAHWPWHGTLAQRREYLTLRVLLVPAHIFFPRNKRGSPCPHLFSHGGQGLGLCRHILHSINP